MSEIAIGASGTETDRAFNRGAMLLIAGIGILAFLAMLVLGAYAPDLRSGKNGGSHALSNAATGYSGLVRLAGATGRNPRIVRQEQLLDTEDLVVITPEQAATPLDPALGERAAKPTLIVLPKWQAGRDPAKPGWVRVSGLLPPSEPEGVLAPGDQLEVTRAKTSGQILVTVPGHAPSEMQFPAPPVLQTISGKNLQAVITDGAGKIVVGKLPGRPWYVVADADLLNNHGMASPQRAAAALALLDFVNSTESTGVSFDVTLNGLGRSRSPLRLAFDPPFLSVTIAILAALLLAGIQALARFGVPLRPERAIAFGKTALVDNTAALVRKAGREGHLGGRYAETIRDRMVALLRLPPTLGDQALIERLDNLKAETAFSDLAQRAESARTREDVLAAARALHQWQQEIRS